MINPSASGWIDKYFLSFSFGSIPAEDDRSFYLNIRATGFVYGHITTLDHVNKQGWTSEEISKVALFQNLYQMYRYVNNDHDKDIFIKLAVSFYRDMHPGDFNFLQKMLPSNSDSVHLEQMIDDRVQTNGNIISKNFSHILTNALLFEDVLAFRQYLLNGHIPQNYLKKLEESVVSIVSSALGRKSNKSEYDLLLTKLFEASVRYTRFSKPAPESESLSYDYFTFALEKYYLIDMAVLALWSDLEAEENEIQYVYNLAAGFDIEPEFVASSIAVTDRFIRNYKHEIAYFQYSNPVKHFYDQASQTVMLLIKRNKTRLLKELSNNGELMLLLTHSTHRSLDDKEKKKIRKQLLEVCKTIPSLAIFLLPGGSLLLPLLVKFIPKMLPSAFNENLDTDQP